MEEKEYNVVTLEDGVEYTEIDRLDDNNNVYVFLANLEKPEDFCVRKLIEHDNEKYIVGLEDKVEFDRIFNIFMKRYTN